MTGSFVGILYHSLNANSIGLYYKQNLLVMTNDHYKYNA